MLRRPTRTAARWTPASPGSSTWRSRLSSKSRRDCRRYTGLVDDLPPRWRLRYDEAFLLRFATCAVTVAYKVRTLPAADGYLASCIAEELEANERGRKWEDDYRLDAVLEHCCTDRQYEALYATGENRWPERALASAGIWERDLRYRSLLHPLDPEGLPPLHRARTRTRGGGSTRPSRRRSRSPRENGARSDC